jgi:hypothetical protein
MSKSALETFKSVIHNRTPVISIRNHNNSLRQDISAQFLVISIEI